MYIESIKGGLQCVFCMYFLTGYRNLLTEDLLGFAKRHLHTVTAPFLVIYNN